MCALASAYDPAVQIETDEKKRQFRIERPTSAFGSGSRGRSDNPLVSSHWRGRAMEVLLCDHGINVELAEL
jgi:hypothetical protein